jgi:polysaccharide chain length determinant protein (PEP-CTERM system associated)
VQEEGIMQPSQDLLTIPRRPLDVEDYIDIVRRHKTWIAGPAFAAIVVAVVGAFLWPDTYSSEATVQVVPPQVPERYVQSNVNSEMSSRINQMAQSVQSRASLINIINSNNLYKNELQRKPLEDVLEDMRRAIKISPVVSMQQGGGRAPISAFRVSFAYSNRFQAQKVTAELTNGFIDENLRSLQNSSNATTAFLQDQWQAARKKLQDLEAQVTQFRKENAGKLPDERQGNLTTLRTLESQLSGINESMSRIGQEKLLMESQIRIYKDQLASLTQGGESAASAQAKSERLIQAERQIALGENELARLRERYMDTYPDVQAAKAQLAMLKRNRDAMLKEDADKRANAAPPKPLNPENVQGGRQLEASIQSLQSQIQAKDIELERRAKNQQQLVSMINQYNTRIQSSPDMEQRYEELTRDYGLAKARYEQLNTQKSQSEIATNLESRGQGERLQLLDPASLTETPVQPKRIVIIGAGAGLGLLLGVFIAGGREMKDTSLKNLKDARAYTNLPVLGTVPLLENDLVVRRKRRMLWLSWSTACLLGIVAMAGSVYYYYSSRV